jgi:hypothetical protein
MGKQHLRASQLEISSGLQPRRRRRWTWRRNWRQIIASRALGCLPIAPVRDA